MREKAMGVFIVLLVAGAIGVGVQQGIFLLPGSGSDAGKPDAIGEIMYGPVYSRPDHYQRKLLRDPWVRRIPIGKSNFGALLLDQHRFSIEGTGPMVGRTIGADTKPAARLLSGDSRDNTLAFIHGLQRVLDERSAYIKGVSFSRSHNGYLSNSLVWFVDSGVFDSYASNLREQRQLVNLLILFQQDIADSWAWFQFDSSWIVVAAPLSQQLEQALVNPKSVEPGQQLFVAYVLRHELEHSVSAADLTYESYQSQRQLSWLEESVADTMARWPGVAADMANELGLRYPKRAAKLSYDKASGKQHISGYDEWVGVMRRLLVLAGIDVNDPKAFDKADELLQQGKLEQLSGRLAAGIARQQHLSMRDRSWLRGQIPGLDGRSKRMTQLERQVRRRARKR